MPVYYANYKYPGWAEALGWLMVASSLICIPTLMIIQFVKHVQTWEVGQAPNVQGVQEIIRLASWL